MAYKWVQSSAYASVPPNAVVGGNDEDGAMIYVGRAEHEGDMLVCKVVPSKQIGFISQRGEALPKDIFEMLCGDNLAWIKCYDHVIPENAVLCGRTSLEQPVYIGRGHYEGHLIIGKISSVHRALFIAYRGAERRLDSYEILVEEQRQVPGWQLPPPPPLSPQLEKCPLTPPPPPPPAAVAAAAPPPIGLKPYPYPPAYDAPPLSLHDRPPQYTPTPMAQAMGMPMPTPLASTDPYPPPTPSILPSYQQPVGVALPLPPKPALPPSYAPAETAGPAYSSSSSSSSSCSSLGAAGYMPADTYKPPMGAYAPADTYKPPLDPYGPSCSSYTPAQVAPAANYGAGSTHGQLYDVWLPASPGYTPPDAVHGGHDSDMAPLLVCRGYFDGRHIPGKAAPSRGCAYITDAGRELIESNYEVLVGQGKYHWVHRAEGSIAPGAVEAGRAFNGEPLFVGRARYCGSLTPGKVQQSHRCIHIPYGGQEVGISSYEILVRSEIFHRQQAVNLSY
ncbi:translation initiation factor IF-2 [Drosophila albomicans]|uniref:Translation initiation factor IF-2 n=1 Tax=Drosophila albomicans TaxID=7291 RepID=A0A9C6T7Z2_DROAB|nr:translation initiation factor IF-2 [Drosophila albomicans]